MAYRNDPRILVARFDSKCAESGRTIKKGTECLYYPDSKKVYLLDTKEAQNFREWQADLSMGYNY